MVTSAGITIVRAPNPSLMTLDGTNSYLVDIGNGEAMCIDPGPATERHIQSLLDTAQFLHLRITTITVTHNHPDHWPAAPLLAHATGAPIATHASSSGYHDIALNDGDAVGSLHVMYAPGHTFDHIVLYDERRKALFTGDVILGKGTVVIAPPGGSMRDYQRTLHRLLENFPKAMTIYGGHGPVVNNARAKIQEYIHHRESREAELLTSLASGPQTVPYLVQHIYADVDKGLWPAAARQMLAYLIPLEREGKVTSSVLQRPMTQEEISILNPAWESIVGKDQAAVVEAELGAELRIDALRAYSLV